MSLAGALWALLVDSVHVEPIWTETSKLFHMGTVFRMKVSKVANKVWLGVPTSEGYSEWSASGPTTAPCKSRPLCDFSVYIEGRKQQDTCLSIDSRKRAEVNSTCLS